MAQGLRGSIVTEAFGYTGQKRVFEQVADDGSDSASVGPALMTTLTGGRFRPDTKRRNWLRSLSKGEAIGGHV